MMKQPLENKLYSLRLRGGEPKTLVNITTYQNDFYLIVRGLGTNGKQFSF